ncbi:MAG: FtsX-like permease family protein [Bryobacteraceae bacterium]
MTNAGLLQRSLKHYWRTNLAVVVGAAIAVAVLAGSFVVGQSVRGSLRALALERIGNTHAVLAGVNFFREALAEPLKACPLISLEAVASNGKKRSGGVQVYGVDERFFRFHAVGGVAMPEGRQALVSPPLAKELGLDLGGSVLVRLSLPSDIPAEFLQGRREQTGKALRLGVKGILPAEQMGEFALRLSQADVRAVFLPLRTLQSELSRTGEVNTLLFPSLPSNDWAQSLTLQDLGIRIRPLPESLSVEHTGALISDSLAAAVNEAAKETGLETTPIFTYVVNTIRKGNREIPYSLVTALDPAKLGEEAESGDAIFLNTWAARDLAARPGSEIRLEFFVWDAAGGLATRHAEFPLAGILPMEGLAADRDLVPEYKGMTDAKTLHDWDPPFPVDLSRIRPQDEEYWEQYRTTPKAFLPLKLAQPLWQSRFGKLTSIRLEPTDRLDPFAQALRRKLNPLEQGLTLAPIREDALAASSGATDFGEYFVYFSFFLVIAALLLAGLFFRTGIEQRLREIGLLAAMGYPRQRIRNLFLAEAGLLSLAGGLLGVVGALIYASGILYGLTTFWIDAVGTTRLHLHPSPDALGTGFVLGVLASLGAALWTLRSLRKRTPRSLLAGIVTEADHAARSSVLPLSLAVLCTLGALALAGASFAGAVPAAGAFFGTGALLLAAALTGLRAWMRRHRRSSIHTLAALGLRGAAHRGGRSLLSMTLIALATFLLLSLESFRQSPNAVLPGAGGFALMAESVLPVFFNPNTAAGRASLNLDEQALAGARIFRFRVKPGDDSSCLNLYQPRNPRVVAPAPDFVAAKRFRFQASLAETDRERENPWLLLNRRVRDGIIPAIADANSLTYVLHSKVGDVFEISDGRSEPVKVRFVAALADSVFQSEVLIAENHFQRLYPSRQGYVLFLIDAPQEKAAAVSDVLEDTLADYGFDARPAQEKLAQFHRVENAYLSTFQALGALGLLLGTAGLAAVLIRNILEARTQLALLQAVGFRAADLARLVVSENLFLVACGLTIGVVAALVAIAPALAGRGGVQSLAGVVWIPPSVLAVGALASWAAIQVLRRQRLLEALRSE